MTTYAIDTDNNITAFETAEQVTENQERFTGKLEFAAKAEAWPGARLVAIWNSFAGVPPFGELKPVKKFTNKESAIQRIWDAIQVLTPTPAPAAEPVAKMVTKKVRSKKTLSNAPRREREVSEPDAPKVSKANTVLEMMRRPGGATMPEIMDATGWQKHSVRGFVAGAVGKKLGIAVESTRREDGIRVYRIA